MTRCSKVIYNKLGELGQNIRLFSKFSLENTSKKLSSNMKLSSPMKLPSKDFNCKLHNIDLSPIKNPKRSQVNKSASKIKLKKVNC